jgi:hypothetical protein
VGCHLAGYNDLKERESSEEKNGIKSEQESKTQLE